MLPIDELTKPTAPKRRYFSRLWRGEKGLAVTFWVWGFLVLGATRAADLIAQQHLVTFAEHIGWYYAFMAASLAYAVFAWVAIWRSATKSTARVWPNLAQLWVMLGVLGTPMTYSATYNHLTKSSFSEDDISVIAAQINQSLPTRVDDITLLESASARGKTITYTYRITLSGYSPNLDAMKKDIASSLCVDEHQLALLSDGVLIEYRYLGTRGDIGTVVVSNEDCRDARHNI